ncbi:uncharacterized protein LOC141853835 [Brevipalpus obovatus]|uniref:uncharacterized protein LOC141853835 n=1 Tax=Brevipalpus obovatus TaxID=246614 RepID=UPI003D9E43C2
MNRKIFQIPWIFVVFQHVHLLLCHTLDGRFPVSDGFTSSTPHPVPNDPNESKVIFLPWSCCDGEFRPIEGKVSPFITKPPTNPRENEISVLKREKSSTVSSTGISMMETQTETCCSSESTIAITSQTRIQNILTPEVYSTTPATSTTVEATISESSEPPMISTTYEDHVTNTTTIIDQTPSFTEKETFVDYTVTSTQSTTNSEENLDKIPESSSIPSTTNFEISGSIFTDKFGEEIASKKIVGTGIVVEESLKISPTGESSHGPNLITMPLTESSRQGVSVTDIEQEGPSETYPTPSYSTDEPDLTSEGGFTIDSSTDPSSTDNTMTQPDQESSPTDYPSSTQVGPSSENPTDYPTTEPNQGSSPTDYPGSTQVGPSSENPTDYPMTPDSSQPDYSTPENTDNPTDSGSSTDSGSESTRPTEITRQPSGTSTPTSGSNFPCVKFRTVEDWQNDLSLRALKLRSTLIRVRFIGIHTAQQTQSIMRGVYWLNGLSRSLRRSRFSWTRNLYGHSKLSGLLRCESSFNNFGQRVSGMLWQRRFCCFGSFIFSCGTI